MTQNALNISQHVYLTMVAIMMERRKMNPIIHGGNYDENQHRLMDNGVGTIVGIIRLLLSRLLARLLSRYLCSNCR